ncbi:MAG: ABC transporter substrate-binding protein [Dehalococcoidales bacterium]|nr:ABC transporter substrate-binding protein [Dehalococcoidales bacterium]
MSHRLTRREFLLASVVATVGAAAAACSSTAEPTAAPAAPTQAPAAAPTQASGAAPTQAPAAAPTQAPAAQVKTGGKLRYAAHADVLQLGPWVAIPQSPIFYSVYDTLVKRDLEGKFYPNLAKSWSYSDDGKVVTFELEEGVKFHSGREFSAETIEPAFQYLIKEGGPYHGWMKGINKYEVVSKYKINLHLNQPIAPILTFLDMAQIADPAEGTDVKAKGIGTGPFKVGEWSQGDMLRLVKNPDYWRKGVPYLDEIEIKVWPDNTSKLAALESGNADIAFAPAFQDMPRLAKNADLGVATVPAMCLDVKMNVTKKPYDSKKVRQGIAWACDRQRFVDTYLFGFGEVWDTPLPEGRVGWAPDLKGRIGFDLDKAKQLIADGGFPDGFESTVMIGPDSRAPGMPTMAEILQSDLKKIGVNLKIEQVEATVCTDRWNKGNYDMSIHSYGRLKEAGEVFMAMVWAKNNPEQFRSEEYNKLIDEGMATLDEKKRQDIYHQLFGIMLDESFCIPVAAVPRTIAYSKKVKNFEWSEDGYLRPTEIWLDQ